jgi:putative hydrolase of the HAD superfamily
LIKAVLFDWGNTVIKDFPDQTGPMYAWNKIEKVENSEECLQQLTKTYDCYLATNAKDSTILEIRKALQIVHLNEYFKDIFCFKEIGFEKPSKEYFDIVLKRLSLKAQEVLLVGDNLENDVIGGLQNGMEAILFDPEGKNQYAGLKVQSLLEIETVIHTLSNISTHLFSN